MVDPLCLVQELAKRGIGFFSGVPDSLLAGFISVLPEPSIRSRQHIVAANEGGAVALGVGHHLATGEAPCVYFQNSGLGNALNPLLSLCDTKVHSIPILLIVGWRGQPGGFADEPQHTAQGVATLPLLEAAAIPYRVMHSSDREAIEDIRHLVAMMRKTQHPVALIVGKDSLASTGVSAAESVDHAINGSVALRTLDEWRGKNRVASFVTTGHTIRGIIALHGDDSPPDGYFLNFGAMGHVSQVALTYALQLPGRLVLCIDGDGAAQMHLGALATNGNHRPDNFIHVVLNNQAHASVGGFPTAAKIDFSKVGAALGYGRSVRVTQIADLIYELQKFQGSPQSTLVEVITSKKSANNLPRPKFSAFQNKIRFMNLDSRA